jgi:hypothetical protein
VVTPPTGSHTKNLRCPNRGEQIQFFSPVSAVQFLKAVAMGVVLAVSFLSTRHTRLTQPFAVSGVDIAGTGTSTAQVPYNYSTGTILQ